MTRNIGAIFKGVSPAKICCAQNKFCKAGKKFLLSSMGRKTVQALNMNIFSTRGRVAAHYTQRVVVPFMVSCPINAMLSDTVPATVCGKNLASWVSRENSCGRVSGSEERTHHEEGGPPALKGQESSRRER